ncbi:MAG: VapC toxin family PIN domain ribonuclease [Candidatus Rokuibacteriota bacterium]|nr:MAG: VapC toxin family PIN domain ribonuclease [Candidatus Rokubacteria bacterium]
MRALLDINVLIALLDPDHSLHERAREWFGRHGPQGWTSCPITQNGCVRIMSHPAYPNALPVRPVVERLREATQSPHHEFWPDDVTLLDPRVADAGRIHGPRQLTDLYLLALAVSRGGRFVTFDASVPLTAIEGAEKKHLVVL